MEKNPIVHALKTRGNATAFAQQDVPDELLAEVIDLGTHAPSGTQLQPYAVIVIRDRIRRLTLSKICGDAPWIAQAPVLLLFCLDLNRIQKWAALQDASYDVHNLSVFLASVLDTVGFAQACALGCEALGLSARWESTVLDYASEIVEYEEMPHLVLPVVLLGVGYPKGQPSRAHRLATAALIHPETYQPATTEQIDATYKEVENLFTQWKLVAPEFRKQCQALGVENMAQYIFADRLGEQRIQRAMQSLGSALERAGFGSTPPPEPEVHKRPAIQIPMPNLSGLR
jgi:nitroreductase